MSEQPTADREVLDRMFTLRVLKDMVEAAIAEMPADTIKSLKLVFRQYEEEPPADHPGEEVHYSGTPFNERKPAGYGNPGIQSENMTFYRGPIFRESGPTLNSIRDEVTRAVRHAVGVHYGMSAKHLAKLGY